MILTYRFVIVSLFRGETPLKGETLRKGFLCSGALRGVPAGWVAEDNLAVFFAKLAVAREGGALPLIEFDFNNLTLTLMSFIFTLKENKYNIMEQYKKDFIEFMVRSKALTFGDFVTKSGRHTPFFINTGSYSTGSQLERLGCFYAEALNQNMGDGFNVLFGPAYKGIPLAAAASIALSAVYSRDVSFCFNRKEVKDHGEGGAMVGHKIGAGDRVVIIEDVVTAGTSVRESVQLIKEASPEASVAGLVVSVDRMERGQGSGNALDELMDEFGFEAFSIVNLNEVMGYLHNRKIDGAVVLDDAVAARISEYRREYGCR
ncbi:orotate phosphoribosyltransferase [Fibrobacteres bacterium R8-0-B4]